MSTRPTLFAAVILSWVTPFPWFHDCALICSLILVSEILNNAVRQAAK